METTPQKKKRKKYERRNGKVSRTERINLSFTPYQYAAIKQTAIDNKTDLCDIVLSAFNISIEIAKLFNEIQTRTTDEYKSEFNKLLTHYLSDNPQDLKYVLDLYSDIQKMQILTLKWDKWSKVR